jgi:hypothetical protein
MQADTREKAGELALLMCLLATTALAVAFAVLVFPTSGRVDTVRAQAYANSVDNVPTEATVVGEFTPSCEDLAREEVCTTGWLPVAVDGQRFLLPWHGHPPHAGRVTVWRNGDGVTTQDPSQVAADTFTSRAFLLTALLPSLTIFFGFLAAAAIASANRRHADGAGKPRPPYSQTSRTPTRGHP